MPPPLLICDFDGTITTEDIGDALCDRFADPAWRDLDAAWLRGELSLPEAQRQMWSLVRASREELLAHARAVGAFRDGAEELFAAARRGDIELVIASGGFDLYIDALLGERVTSLAGRYHNRLVSEGDRVVLELAQGIGCERCAVCKGEVVRRWLAPGRRVAFCGDGSSDRCAAGVAPELFAVEGGALARHCAERGLSFVSIRDLRVVLEALCDHA